MANDVSKISYFNTLIFTIVSGIISLLLLMILFFDFGKQNAYFIITIEVGIFMVIAICVYQIIRNESLLNSRKQLSNAKLSFSECPEYFTKTNLGDSVICMNNYKSQEPNGVQYIIKIYDSSEEIPATLQNPQINYTEATTKKDGFKLYEIEQTPEFKNAIDQCAYIINEPKPTTGTAVQFQSKFEGYSKTPWLHAKARCAPYVDN